MAPVNHGQPARPAHRAVRRFRLNIPTHSYTKQTVLTITNGINTTTGAAVKVAILQTFHVKTTTTRQYLLTIPL